MLRFMRKFALVLSLVLTIAHVSFSQEPETPIGPRWRPSEWGPEDQRGALNRITPPKVFESEPSDQRGKSIPTRASL